MRQFFIEDWMIREAQKHYGPLNISQVKALAEDILNRYFSSEYFDPDFFEDKPVKQPEELSQITLDDMLQD
jgi:hypothetical protein